MSWENRFSTMVKESSTKIDKAKQRLHSIDKSSSAKGSKSTLSVPFASSGFQTKVHHNVIDEDTSSYRRCSNLFSFDSASVELLHSLCEKAEKQDQVCDFLKTKVETLEKAINKQQQETKDFKEQLFQVCNKVDQVAPTDDHRELETWKSEIKGELNHIYQKIHEKDAEGNDAVYEQNLYQRNSFPKNNDHYVLNSLQEIRSRLDIIELKLSSCRCDADANNKRIDKNAMLLGELKISNTKYLERLDHYRDLSVDEISYIRSEVLSAQERLCYLEETTNRHKLRNDFSDYSSAKNKSKNVLNDGNPIPENENPSEVDHILSVSSVSDENDNSSLTGSSFNLDVSDNGDLSLQIDEMKSEKDTENHGGQGSNDSEIADSSLETSFSESETSVNDI